MIKSKGGATDPSADGVFEDRGLAPRSGLLHRQPLALALSCHPLQVSFRTRLIRDTYSRGKLNDSEAPDSFQTPW